MSFSQRISQKWFSRPTLKVASDLLGCSLVSVSPEGTTIGRIVETEAYCGPQDKGAHSSGGKRTKRNEIMFGEAGHAYVYLIYGMYLCFNVTTDTSTRPHAVLIRALQPIHGVELMRQRAPKIKKDIDLCRGPGRLCRAMNITCEHYGLALFDNSSSLTILKGKLSSEEEIQQSARIGIPYAEEYAEMPWRYFVKNNPCVSREPA